MTIDFDAHTRSQSARFAEVLRDVDPTSRVLSCPDWTAGDLLWHLAEVHWSWATIVRDRITDEDAVDTELEATKPARPGDHAGLLALFDRTTGDLLDALGAAADDVSVWTWAPEQTVGFVRRFQAHEALMHRVDAELTAGTLTDLPADLAADGVDVVLRYSMSWRPRWASWTPTGVVGELQTTDTDRRSTVTLGTWSGTSPDTGQIYDSESAVAVGAETAPTFTVSAPAADLDAWLWGRPGFGAMSVDGVRADYDAFAALVSKGVQ